MLTLHKMGRPIQDDQNRMSKMGHDVLSRAMGHDVPSRTSQMVHPVWDVECPILLLLLLLRKDMTTL